MSSKHTGAGERLIEEGRALLGAGNIAQAETCLRQALAESPELPEALHLLGVAAIQRGDLEQAVILIQRATIRKRSDPRYFDNLGIALSRLGRPEPAERAFRRALRIDPTLADYHSHLGVALADQGKLVEALQSQDRAARLKPGSAVIHCHRALALKSLGRLEEAAIACAPDAPAAHQGLGIVLGMMGRYADADACLRKALAAEPGNMYSLTWARAGMQSRRALRRSAGDLRSRVVTGAVQRRDPFQEGRDAAAAGGAPRRMARIRVAHSRAHEHGPTGCTERRAARAAAPVVALVEGKPVIGLAANIEQFLNMAAVQDASCGRLLRACSCSEIDIRSAVVDVLSNPCFGEGALRIKRAIADNDTFARFRHALRDLTGDG
jgi:Flp pilus assembly protein TadD